MTHIQLKGMTKVYDTPGGPVTAVDNVELSVESGELFFLLGPSGCGKTTLLRMIAGLHDPTAGRIYFGDKDVTDLPCEKRNTAMVFQNYALWPHMTVAQNVEFGPKMRGVGRKERRQIARASLERVEMQEFERRKPNQLSGGQQQRVAVARALAAEPDCLLLDEPLSNLDARLRTRMRTELRELVKSAGTTAIYVTHDQKEALSMADRIAVMNAGRIVQVAAPEMLYDRPADRFVADFLGEANFLTGRVVDVRQQVRVETPAGVLWAAGDRVAAVGQDVLCCVRPERVSILPAGQAEPSEAGGVLPARVLRCIYLGETRQYLCRLHDGTIWKVFILSAGAPPVPAGQDVQLRISPQHVTLLQPS